MLKTDQQQFQQPQYPAFPVIFQKDIDGEFVFGNFTPQTHSKKIPTVPEQDAISLYRLTSKIYEPKYSQLFSQSFQNQKNSLQMFFKEYVPFDGQFVQQMKKQQQTLSIMKLGTNKIYVGQIKDNKCNGKSIILFKNGSLYQGEMANNKRQGRGTYIHINLGWYKGDFKDDLKHGEGIQILYNKSAYKGQFVNGLKHEQGLYMNDEGNIYYGIWKLGIIHGRGTLKTPKSIYLGVFVNWLKHGSGQEHFANGDIYRGQYQNGRFDGIGTYEWKNQGAVYQGNFKNGLRHGKGKWQKGETKYNGGYIQGLKQGYGQLYFPSGNFYKGNFFQDKKEGYGQMFWTDSSFYKGEWKNGLQSGKGQAYLAGGDIVSGIFQNSILVQAMPTIYEKQMEISNLSIQDLLGSKKNYDHQSTRERTFSETKGFSQRKRLAKIQETTQRHKKAIGSIHGKMYFKSPDKSDHSENGCGTCNRRNQNFRLKQRNKKFINYNSYIRQDSRHDF